MEARGELYPLYPVLIVDDDENQLTSLSIALRSAGFNNLRVISDSRNVLGVLERETFSLVILDLHMPHVTGHDILRQSAAMEKRPPLVIITGSRRLDDFVDGAAGGVVDYLVKPFDRERLVAVVQRVLVNPSGNRRGRLTRNYLLSDLFSEGSRLDGFTSAAILELLQQTKREYRRLIGGLPTPYVLLEEESHRIRYCNDAFLRFLGTGSDVEARQSCFFDMIDHEDRTRTIRILRERGELREEELRGRTPSGRSFVIVGSFQRLADDGFVEGGFVDVTEPRRLQQELARAQRLESVGRLAAGLAHDFNNTLLIVSGFVELIASGQGVPQTILGYAEEIRSAAANAGTMIRQLLSVGKAPPTTDACADLQAVLRQAEASLRLHLRGDQSLVLSLAADTPLVGIPASRLDEVVRNLVLNARDAMPDGGTITITTRRSNDASAPASERIQLEVKDTGVGMDARTMERIFEPFFTTKSPGRGTGLGLSTARMIIEAVGGHICVDSAPGSGTVFRIDLPLANASRTRGECRPDPGVGM